MASIIAVMDQVLIVENFVRLWGGRIESLASGALGDWRPTKGELKTFTDAVEAVANDSDGKSTLEAATFEDEKRKVRVAFTFSTKEAKACQETIDLLYRKEESPDEDHFERVLMVFTRTDVGEATVGIRSGERVVISKISEKTRPIMYSSKLAEERIKYEIREPDENVYKKGFVVDVDVTMAGQATVYAVRELHSIIDLPEDGKE